MQNELYTRTACEFPSKELVLTAVYGFGEEAMLLFSNLKIQEKKQRFELEDLRVMSLQSIRNLNLFAIDHTK